MPVDRLKIFVSAYACEPNMGSEIGVGWHWVLEMSKFFDLWVLTRQSNQANIKKWMKENPVENIPQFVYFDLPKKLRFWKKGLRGVRIYYVLWQRLSNKIVKQTMEGNGIEIYHLLTYGNALWPASRYGQKKFFIWGPIGVGDTIPKDFSIHYNFKGRLIEWARRLSVKTLPLNRGFQKRCDNANLIFCKTQTAFKSIPVKYRNKAVIFTDVAVEIIKTAQFREATNHPDSFIHYLAVGRLEAWRGFDLLLEAFANAIIINSNIRLEILGNGSDRKRLEKLIEKRQLQSCVSFPGQVSLETYYQKMAACDVVVNPALKEGAVTAAFDSLSFGKPLICIDTGGYTRCFKNDYAIVIPRNSRNEVVENLAKGILKLTDKELRIKIGTNAWMSGRELSWEFKGKEISREVMQSYNKFIGENK